MPLLGKYHLLLIIEAQVLKLYRTLINLNVQQINIRRTNAIIEDDAPEK